MNRAIQVAGVVWLSAVMAICADQTKPPKPAPPPKNPPAAAKPAPKAPPNNPGGAPKGAARIPNPDNPVDRLLRMTPDQRERALEKLPPQQQANIRKWLENFDKQPQAQRERRLQQLNELWSLPSDKRQLVSQQIKAFDALPPDRLAIVRQAYVNLSRMTPEERDDRLARPQFRSRFTPAELQILSVLPQYYPAPGARPNQ
jgi:hypothetical protein